MKTRCEGYKKIYNQNKKSERFANWYYEKMLLGYTYNISLRDIFIEKSPDLVSVREVVEADLQERLIFIGSIDDCFTGVSRKGTSYYKAMVSDETGTITTMIFNKKMESCEAMNPDGLPKKNEIVICKGTKFEDAIFADVISTQNNKIYTKLSELKDK